MQPFGLSKQPTEQYLKCDSPDCDHIEFIDDITEEFIDMPCPVCGSNLLTREDYDAFEETVKPLMEMAKALSPTKGGALGGDAESENAVEIDFHIHKNHLTVQVP